jgi:hypothetical protein
MNDKITEKHIGKRLLIKRYSSRDVIECVIKELADEGKWFKREITRDDGTIYTDWQKTSNYVIIDVLPDIRIDILKEAVAPLKIEGNWTSQPKCPPISMCFCIGPENCNNTCCEKVQKYKENCKPKIGGPIWKYFPNNPYTSDPYCY